MPVRITTTNREFGQVLAVGQVFRRSQLHEHALVASELARWVDPVSGLEVAGNVIFPEDGSFPVPITSRQFLNPASYGIALGNVNRLYELDGEQLRFAGGEWRSNTTNVIVTGVPAVGEVLTATVVGGTASGLQWTRNGSAIAGATSATYTLQGPDAGQVIRVQLSGFAPLSRAIRP